MKQSFIPVGMYLADVGVPALWQYYIHTSGSVHKVTKAMEHNSVYPIILPNNDYKRLLTEVEVPEGYRLVGRSVDTAFGVLDHGMQFITTGGGGVDTADAYTVGLRRLLVEPITREYLVITVPVSNCPSVNVDYFQRDTKRLRKRSFINAVANDLVDVDLVEIEIVKR